MLAVIANEIYQLVKADSRENIGVVDHFGKRSHVQCERACRSIYRGFARTLDPPPGDRRIRGEVSRSQPNRPSRYVSAVMLTGRDTARGDEARVRRIIAVNVDESVPIIAAGANSSARIRPKRNKRRKLERREFTSLQARW